MQRIPLNNGMAIPPVGLGTYLIKPEPCEKAVLHALTHGYDLIDTANIYMNERGILLQSWFPLGQGDPKLVAEEVFQDLAKKYSKTPHQIILKWHVQSGFCVIPGSKTPSHIDQNIDLFDFELTEEEMERIQALDRKKRYYNFPRWAVRMFMPLIRMNYEKQP